MKRETGGIRKRGRVWWIWYHHEGQRYDESTKQGDEREARRLLAQRRRELSEGTEVRVTKVAAQDMRFKGAKCRTCSS